MLHLHLYYSMFNISKYDSTLYFEKLNIQGNLLYYYNSHFHTKFTKISKHKFLLFLHIIAISQETSLLSAVYVQKGYMVSNLVNICC